MIERLTINVLVAAGTLGLTWGPIVYLVHTLQTLSGVTA